MISLRGFAQDIRYGIRQLSNSPGFTIVAVLSLALGIGANTSIFQIVDAVRLRALPVQNPQELVAIDFEPQAVRAGWFSTRSARFTYSHWEQIRKQQQAFSGVMAWSAARFNLSDGGEARHAEGLYVSGNFYSVLGVNPAIGRVFTAQDDTGACSNPGAVLSDSFWRREFAGDPGALGRTVSLDGHKFPVIGVTPPAFFGVEVGSQYDVAIPLCADPLLAEDKKGRIPKRFAWWLSMMGRLKPGWTPEKATAHLHTLSPGIMQLTIPSEYRPDTAKRYLENKLMAAEGGTGVSNLRRQYERPLWLLTATTGLVLLIACANLANLLLARASVREREIAVRLAIGASRWRLVRQLLAESLLLATIGAALGAALAQVLTHGLLQFLNTDDNRLFVQLHVDLRILGFTAALAVTTCVLFGLVPALRATHLSPSTTMRSSGRGLTDARQRFGLRRALVSTQVALSLVLLVGALLFVRSLRNLLTVDAGFKPEGVLSVSIDFKQLQYPKERRPAVQRQLLEHLAAAPGVISAAQTMFTPVSGSGWNETIRPEGAGVKESGKDSEFNRVSPGYFRTMGTPFISGRDFAETDHLTAPKVSIVNEAFARKYFGATSVVGRRFLVEGPVGTPDPVYEIVGVVRNTKYYQLRENFIAISFLPMAQNEDAGADGTYVLRVAGPVGSVMNNVKKAVAEVSPVMGLQFRLFSGQLQESLMRERLMATLSGGFGLLAGLLSTLGLYGVIAYMVARRRNEIGLRIALGADRGNVIGLVLREAVLLLGVGLVAGTFIALWAGRAASTLLFGLQPHDPVTFAAAVLLLSGVALAASYAPAMRAAAVEPMAALRDE